MMEHGLKDSDGDSERKRAEENNKLLKRMLVRKGVTALVGLYGGEKVLDESGDVDVILDVLDIADLEDSDK